MESHLSFYKAGCNGQGRCSAGDRGTGLMQEKARFVMVSNSVAVLPGHFQEVVHVFCFCFHTYKMEIALRNGRSLWGWGKKAQHLLSTERSHESNGSSSPGFDTYPILHPTSGYSCLLPIFSSGGKLEEEWFSFFGWISNTDSNMPFLTWISYGTIS